MPAAAAVATAVITSLIGAALTILSYLLVRRSLRARARQEWLQAGQLGLAEAMRGEKSVEEIGAGVLAFLARYPGFHAGAVLKGEGGHFVRVATLGVPADGGVPDGFGLGHGLLGRVAAEGEAIVVDDVPDAYLTIGSAFGSDKPRQLVIVPARADDAVNAVLELGFFRPAGADALALLDQASEAIGVALRSARSAPRPPCASSSRTWRQGRPTTRRCLRWVPTRRARCSRRCSRFTRISGRSAR